MPNNFKDTYFLDSKTALKEAKQQNRVQCTKLVDGLQICYYAGVKLKNTPKNCINVPLEKLYSYFKTTSNRAPNKICYENTIYKKEDRDILTKEIVKIINKAFEDHKKLTNKYKEKIKLNKPDFSEKQWRVFIPTCRETVVMKHVSTHIANTFEKMGYKVFFHIQKNDMQFCSQFSHLKALYKCNPHITININHFNNGFLHKDVYNFIWIQDPMPQLMNKESKIQIRKRDFVYSLVKPLDLYLENKNIPFQRQRFAINTDIYKTYKKIKKEKKIVFIGSSYSHMIQKDTPHELLDTILDMYKKGLSISEETVRFLASKYKQDFSYVYSRVIPFIIRDCTVIELCKTNTPYKIEIYGWGWEQYEDVKPYFKGNLKYGKEIAKVYSSATYSLSPHSSYVLQQRVLESASSGCIPIVYDCKINDEAPYYEDELIYFNKPSDLKNILEESPQRKMKKIIKENTYKHFAKRIIKQVKKSIGEQLL